jgi:hypothetical protein
LMVEEESGGEGESMPRSSLLGFLVSRRVNGSWKGRATGGGIEGKCDERKKEKTMTYI